MKLIFSTIALCSLALTSVAFANDEKHEDKVVHYEAAKPATEAEAFALLKTTESDIAKVLEKAKLEDADFEQVHEKSYALLAGVEKLEEHVADAKKEQFAKLKHEAEEVHEEAEEHNAEKLHKHFTAFKAALTAYEAK